MAAVVLKMQILCWISICCLISHGRSLNLNRPSSRWARSDDSSDGWQASNGPSFLAEPVATYSVVSSPRTTSTTTHTQSSTSSTPTSSSSVRTVREEGSPFLPATSPEGFYEVVVGKKSPVSSELPMGAGSNASTGSPDVIIGRVMSTTGVIESAPTTTTSVVGYSHPLSQFQPVVTSQHARNDEMKMMMIVDQNNGEEKAAHQDQTEDRSDIDGELLEMESRSSGSLINKKADYPLLPPGSFYLPAVSRQTNQYFSNSEQAIYIPLRRPDQATQVYPMRTNVVFVGNKQQPPAPLPPPSGTDAVYLSKEGDEEEEEEEKVEEEEIDEEENEEDLTLSSIPPTKTHSGALDLVMTLYPSLPKLMSSSPFTTQGIKNLLKINKNPALPPVNAGGASVIHDAKVVAPPQGYLPQWPSKPILPVVTAKPNLLAKPIGSNTLLSQSRKPSYYAPDQRHHPTATNGFTKTAIQFTPFTPDDISPLNFLLPAASSSLSSSSSSADKVATGALADQADTRSNNYGTLPSNGESLAESNVHITQSPLKVVPAPKLDFSWNLFQPLASEVSHQQTAASDFPLFSLTRLTSHSQPRQQEKSQSQQGQREQQEQTKPESSGHLLVPGETGEIVVRTKMATSSTSSGNDSGNRVNRPGISDSVDIITGYYNDQSPTASSSSSSSDKPWNLIKNGILPAEQSSTVSASLLSSTTPSQPSDDKERQTTVPSLTTLVVAAEEVITTTTTTAAPSTRNDETVKPAITSIPKLYGNFQPMVEKFPHRVEPQDRSHQPGLVSEIPLVSPSSPAIRVIQDEDDDVYSAPRLPDIADDQHVAGSQIHETSVYEENLPRVRPIKAQSTDSEGEGKSSTPYYKVGKMSPKGAMYTVTQGHSKVKFFGFNALHNGELKPIDAKFFLLQQEQQDRLEQEEHDWKFSPYLPVRLSTNINPAFKVVPKKSIPISGGKKSGIRPVFFAKRPPVDGQAENSSSNSPWSPSIVLSEPFEYHAHLEKMAEEQGRLPSQLSTA